MDRKTLQQKFTHAVNQQRVGNLAAAQRHCRSILKKFPQHGETLQLLAILMQQSGNNRTALHLMHRALEASPGNPQLLKNLAEIYRIGNDYDEARIYAQQVLEIEPDNPDALYILAASYSQQHQPGKAVEQFRRLLEIAPDDYHSRNELANQLCLLGEPEQAVDHYQRALEFNPDFTDCRINLADTWLELNEIERAVDEYNRVTESEPGNALAHKQLGIALEKQGRIDQAVVCYQVALEYDPCLLQARINLGRLMLESEPRQAESWFRSALDIDKEFADGYYWLGVLFQTLGKFERATNYLLQAIRVNPEMVYAWYRLSLDHSFKPSNAQIEMLEKQFARLSTATSDQNLLLTLGFTLGRFHDQQLNPAMAFNFYQQANRIKASQNYFDYRRHDEQIAKVIDLFDHSFFRDRGDWGSDSELPVFIVGMPRSGTSLVEQIIASHPRTHGAGELKLMLELVASLKPEAADRASTHAEQIAQMDRQQIIQMAIHYLEQIRELDAGADKITDKLPGNYFRLGLIHLLFPRARIIHCHRDPLDTCWSCYQQNFDEGLHFSYDLENLGHAYLGYQKLMAHWHQQFPGQILDVCYEELIANPVETSQKILRHCELEWDAGVLSYHHQPRSVTTASLWQVRQPLYSSSIGRYRPYQEFLQPLQQVLSGAR